MRRIIERVVTVVTTTTWKISWEPDSPHPQPGADRAPEIFTNAEALPIALSTPDPTTLTEIKEADSESAEKPTESNTPALEIQSYPSNSERK